MTCQEKKTKLRTSNATSSISAVTDINWPLIFSPGLVCLFVSGATALQWAMASSLSRLHGHTQRCATVGRTPLDEWSARRRDLYLTTHNTHDRHPCHRWDSIPQSQQASSRRPTPQTARPLGPAYYLFTLCKIFVCSGILDDGISIDRNTCCIHVRH